MFQSGLHPCVREFLKQFTEENLRNRRKILRKILFFNGFLAMATIIKCQVFVVKVQKL